MRLLGLNNSYPPVVRGGYGEICADVMDGLAERGHDVTMLVCGESYAPLPSVDEPMVKRELEYVLAPWRRPVSGLRAAVKDDRVIRRYLAAGVDAVLAWHCRGIMKSSLRRCHEAGVPVFYFLHDRWVLYERPGALVIPWARLDRLGAGLPRELLGRAVARRVELRAPPIARDGHVCYVSHWLRSEHERRGFRPRHDATVPCGVRVERFARPTPPANPPATLLFAGRIEKRKGLDVVIRALAVADTTWTLTVVGPVDDPKYETYVRGLASDLRIDGRIRWCGEVPRATVRAMLAEHDVLVFPSVGAEAYALGLLEALAAGVFVVTSAPGGPREYLDDGVNCLIHEPGDSEGLAGALHRLRTEPQLAATLLAGAARTADAISLEKVLEQVEGLILDDTQ